ncbi:ABC transporter substrate-binding protein [Lichenihabitans psoromatis]|uniref:ABC transporter substrate-binding protein n=1 Tax=Lichenihabitans psoromatis TaxID=2528642 RepID=UPI001A93BF38|nr:ABC transporter substrate-binding protein [Lichenihabitans psoromatis]
MNIMSALKFGATVIITVGVVLPASAETIGNCELYGAAAVSTITPAKSGQLTVEVNLPAPGWWNGDTPGSIKDGYEYCLAANVAHRLGLGAVQVVNVDFDALVAGQTRAFDLALSEISITDERKKVVDFSVPYFSSDIGILAKAGTKVTAEGVKSLRIGVTQGTTGADFVADKIKPTTTAKVFPDAPSMITALQAGQIDLAMTDTAIVLGQASASSGLFAVVGQYTTGEQYGAVYPKNSPNRAVIDKILQSLIDDGSTKKLASKYLAASWGLDPATIPYFKP